MADFPNLLTGTVAMRPVMITQRYSTGVIVFGNGEEQRYANIPVLAGFVLTFTNVNSYDRNVMMEFFISKKGRFVDTALTNTFSIVDTRIPGAPYNWCFFDQDQLIVRENMPLRFSFQLQIRQARKN